MSRKVNLGKIVPKKGVDYFDGKDGADGFSPNATITETDTGATFTVTDKDGTTTVTLSNGKDGVNGVDGFSPVATVTQTETGATISITDVNGTTTAEITNGKDGEGGTGGGSGYSETELLDAPANYTLKSTTAILNSELVINDNVTNYDELVFDCALTRSSDGALTMVGQTRILVSNISYNTASDYTKVTDGSNLFLNVICNGGNINVSTCAIYFKNENTIAIAYTTGVGSNYNYFRIRSIKGIKY